MRNKNMWKPTSREVDYSIIRNLYDNRKDKRFLIEVNNFLRKYPDDESAHFMRGRIYKDQERYDEAISDFKLANRRNNNLYAIEELFFTYYYLRMYKEALKLIPSLRMSNYITPKNIKIMSLVMKKELGILNIHDKFNISDYSEYQILDYSKDDTYNHIKTHNHDSQKDKSKFKCNININYLFDLVNDSLPSAKRSKEKSQMDIYYFGISNVGYSKSGENANFIKVVVVPNTYNITSMFPIDNPCDDAMNLEYDYNKLFSKDESKVKKKSQIEKFNKRYQKSTI